MKKYLFIICSLSLAPAFCQIKSDTLEASKLFQKADSLLETGQFDASIAMLQKAGNIYRNYKLWNRFYLCQQKMADDMVGKGQFEEAADLIESNLEEIKKLYPGAKNSKALLLNTLGFIFLNKGRNDLALEKITDALNLLGSAASKESAECYTNLGTTHWNNGNLELAVEFHFKALALRREFFGETHIKTAGAYNNLGLDYSTINNEMALGYYQKALAIYQKIYPGGKQPTLAFAYNNIGIILRKNKEYNQALDNFEKVLTIWQSVYSKDHPNVAFTYSNIGQVFLEKGSFQKAIDNFMVALEIYKKNFGDKHPELANTYNLMGSVYEKQGRLIPALKNYQLAICANSNNFEETSLYKNPSAASYYNAPLLLTSLDLKSQALDKYHYTRSLKKKDLIMALETLKICDTLIDNIRQSRTSKADKVALGTTAADIYESGIKLCLDLSEVSLAKRKYLQEAFYFSEKNKSSVLLEAISETNAKSFAHISDTILESERQMKADISFYEQKLAQLTTPAQEKSYRDKLFIINRKYESFVAKLNEDFPEYYNLKFNVKTASIADIQQLIDKQTALISYFTGENSGKIYIFYISKTDYKVINVDKHPDFDKYIRGLRNAIKFSTTDVYAENSYLLYKQLFPVRMKSSIQKLIIIPDGGLGTVPYEALLQKKTDGQRADYTGYPFLIKKYAVSYNYSATLFKETLSKKKNQLQNSAFLCAPVSFKQPSGPGLSELPGTANEISLISKIFTDQHYRSLAYTGADATEKAVKSDGLSAFKYLHFATHGLVNERQPELSQIFLSADKSEDGNLYSGEIYNLNIKADLVTLSACQTGLGKVTKGEGIIGLSRALLYAGSRNLVVSLWSVSDESTSRLMVDFYGNIIKKSNDNAGYSGSLRTAKLGLLSHATYANPYYWAPFVLIGN